MVQTTSKIIERCMLMTTYPGALVLDPTCGSGTTAYVGEKCGRRVRYPHEGLRGGFIYKTVPHVTLKSIANNPEIEEIHARLHPEIANASATLNQATAGTLQEGEIPFDCPEAWSGAARAHFDAFHAARQAMQREMDRSIAAHADQEILYDQPEPDKAKLRITGPFTVEAVTFPTVLALAEQQHGDEGDLSIARSGESARQHAWRGELLKAGIRGKGGQILRFAELETLPDSPYLHVTGSLADTGERVVVSFGPEHAALEQRQVALALNEAEKLRPAVKYIVFAAFEFDPEAAKDIDETRWPGVTLVHGFDYFDTAKGELVSGGKGKIAMWLLDTDYDERSLFPRQVFFPLAGQGEGWERLKRNIRAELNEELLAEFHGTVSLPFEAGENRKVAVKIVDDRGIESLKILAIH